jgi:transposase
MGKAIEKVNAGRRRSRFTKEFKLEAVRLLELSEKPATQLAVELGIRRNQLHKWQAQLRSKGLEQAFRGPGAKPLAEHSELELLRRELRRCYRGARHFKKPPSRAPASHMHRNKRLLQCIGVWTVAVCFLEALTPAKNLAQGKLRTQLWWHNP